MFALSFWNPEDVNITFVVFPPFLMVLLIFFLKSIYSYNHMFRLNNVSSYMYFKNGKLHAIPLELLIPESVELGLMMLYYITYLLKSMEFSRN